MSYLDQVNNIQNSLFSYQEQLQGQQDSLASQAQQLLNEKIQNVAEKLEFIGTAGMAGIETLGKVKDLATKGVKIYEKGKQAVQEGIQQASETAQNVVEGARTGAQRLVAGAQQVSENLGFGEQTTGLTSRLSAGIDTVAGQAQGAIQGATEQTQAAVGQADEAVAGAAARVEGAVSGAQSELRGGLDTLTTTARQGTQSAGQQLQSRLAQLEQLGTDTQETVRATAEQVSGVARAGAQQLDTAAQAAADLPRVSVPSLTANLPENPTLNLTMSDPADTALTRLLPTDLTDVSSTAAGRFSAGVLAQRPEIQAALRQTTTAAGQGGQGSSVRMGDAINEFLDRTAPPPRARISTASDTPTQPSLGQQNIARQQQSAFETDPEAGVRFETDFSNIPEIGNLEASTATNALSGGSTVVAGSRVSGAVGATTETAGTNGTLTTTGTTSTATGTTVTTTGDTAATAAGATAGEEAAEGIGSLIGDAIPVVGELAMLGTALAGIFESVFKHPVETFTPQIVSAVGYDPSSLTSTFTGEGGTV